MNRVTPINDYQVNSNLQGEVLFALDEAPACRICLEGQLSASEMMNLPLSRQADELLINPCKCKGSVAFIHQKCIKQWFTKDFATHGERDSFCQLCQQKLFFHVTTQFQCAPCENQKSFGFIFCLILQFLLIAMLSLPFINKPNISESSTVWFSIYGLLATLLFFFFITIICCLISCCVKGRFIDRVYSAAEVKKLGLMKVGKAIQSNLNQDSSHDRNQNCSDNIAQGTRIQSAQIQLESSSFANQLYPQ